MPDFIRTQILPASEASLKKVTQALLHGEIVALPSETVYGLAGLSFREDTLLKIFKSKERPFFDPLISHIPFSWVQNTSTALKKLDDEGLIDVSLIQNSDRKILECLFKEFWPGPLTFLLPKNSRLPDLATSGLKTTALRCPAHPLFQKVLEAVQMPLCAPSANRFGRISPTSALHVKNELNGKIPFILDGGECDVGIESTVCEVKDGSIQILRPGIITREKISEALTQAQVSFDENFLNNPIYKNTDESTEPVKSPGALHSHYAPAKTLYLAGEEPLPDPLPPFSLILISKNENRDAFLGFFGITQKPTHVFYLSEKNNELEMARNLFKTLREADETPSEIILCQAPIQKENGLMFAVWDRLKKASYKS